MIENKDNHIEKTNYPALGTLVTVFFFWGFIAAGNSIFIPFCKSYFSLDQFQSQLIDFAFYSAYFMGAFFLFSISVWRGKDLVNSWGYRKSIVNGLLFSFTGALTMILAVYAKTFGIMLLGLFILALGFSLQQTAANPLAMLVGPAKSGASRINLGGAVNSLGTMTGPILLALALFGTTKEITDEQIAQLDLNSVILLYTGVGLLFLLAAFLFYKTKSISNQDVKNDRIDAKKTWYSIALMTFAVVVFFSIIFHTYSENSIISNSEYIRLILLISSFIAIVFSIFYSGHKAKKHKADWGALQYPQLVFGMFAIFVYVGVEVAIGSNLSDLLSSKKFGNISSSQTTPYLSMYWGSLMIGRWVGSLRAFNLQKVTRQILTVIVPIFAFFVVLLVNYLVGYDVKPFYSYVIMVFVLIAAFYFTNNKPVSTLYIFSILGLVFLFIGISTSGKLSLYSFLSCGLFCSIMWPAIFQLSLAGLGKYTNQGSSFLIMMIIGGGIIPPIQGKIADIWNINNSFYVGVLCFALLTFFTYRVNKLLINQGIDYEK
jgi:FHS family L-fucose permease-like MFS transporter